MLKRSAVPLYGTKSVPRAGKFFGRGNRGPSPRPSNSSAAIAQSTPPQAPLRRSFWRHRAAHDGSRQTSLAQPARPRCRSSSDHHIEASGNQGTEITAQSQKLPGSNPAHVSIQRSGAIVLAASSKKACAFVNCFAPEHRSLPDNATALLTKVEAAGTVFVGRGPHNRLATTPAAAITSCQPAVGRDDAED